MTDKDFKEDDLREWIISNPQSVLGEQFLLIGREASVKQTGDAIDLLGIDRDGNVVIIELKRGALSGTVDFQGLKYAAYASHWEYSRLQNQFENFRDSSWGKDIYEDETTFTEALDEFCNEDYSVNQDQRVILVGESVRDRLDTVLNWLSGQDIDVTVIEYQLLTDEDRVYLDAERTIPVPRRTGPKPAPSDPWEKDGRSWHLNERTSDETGDLLEEVVDRFSEIERLNEPEWTQKLYVSFKQDRKRRIALRTFKGLFHIDLYEIPHERTTDEELAEALGVPSEKITVGELLYGTGIQITCTPDQEIDLGAVEEKTEELLEAEGN